MKDADLQRAKEICEIRERVEWSKWWDQYSDSNNLTIATEKYKENPKPKHMRAGWGIRDLEFLIAEVERLRRQVDFLRTYGNKDCTAMADAAMAREGRGHDGDEE